MGIESINGYVIVREELCLLERRGKAGKCCPAWLTRLDTLQWLLRGSQSSSSNVLWVVLWDSVFWHSKSLPCLFWQLSCLRYGTHFIDDSKTHSFFAFSSLFHTLFWKVTSIITCDILDTQAIFPCPYPTSFFVVFRNYYREVNIQKEEKTFQTPGFCSCSPPSRVPAMLYHGEKYIQGNQ